MFENVQGLEMWKRGLDIGLSLTALLLTSPVIAATAALIKLTSRGPVVVTQERVGLNRRTTERRLSGGNGGNGGHRNNPDRRRECGYGKPFKMYKFRSMRQDAENGTPVWASENDPRITRLGRVIRKTRIDEIPQFFNVIKGDMSIVGPRPEREYFYGQLEREVPEFPLRLRTKPGITGLAQVTQGYSNTVAGAKVKLNHDLAYIENLRPSTDVRILVKTISVVITGKGAC